MDDVTNILHRTYEVCMRINTDRKSQRTTVGQKARQADHLAWSEDPPLFRELYSLFPKYKRRDIKHTNQDNIEKY
uniref:SFRICE_019924 n=1 Tax=Spodoptera frugiperda TaxID=7108 RepID=A0A2H1WL28_SPOFR